MCSYQPNQNYQRNIYVFLCVRVIVRFPVSIICRNHNALPFMASIFNYYYNFKTLINKFDQKIAILFAAHFLCTFWVHVQSIDLSSIFMCKI